MGSQQGEAREQQALIPAPIATIKLDGWWNRLERHGAMFDLAASEDVKLREGEVKVIPLGIRMKLPEGHFGLVVPRSSTCLRHGILMANSVVVIEPDYCGDSDVWGFVAYAIRDTEIERGTRIAQFMPVPMFGDLYFDVVDSMPYTDRGGYGSTGERSAGASTAEGRTFRDANGLELHVGDYVIDEFGECFCVMGLNGEDGATAAYADLGNSRTSIEVASCLSLRLDERPHDCDGVPIEVGDVLYGVDDSGRPAHWFEPVTVVETSENGGFRGDREPTFWRIARIYTHREPDSFELIAKESEMDAYSYCEEYGIACGDDDCPAEYSMHSDLVRRMRAVAARG